MQFNGFEFWFFFILVLVIYLLLNKKTIWQNRFLLLVSYGFYAFFGWKFLLLIGFITLVDFSVGRALPKAESLADKRWLLALSAVVNLGALGFFKYFNFFVDNFSSFLSTIGLNLDSATLNILLPIGISYYVFRSLSYTIDVYRGQQKPTTNIFDYALFVSFFPLLFAGPIERASHFLPQINKQKIYTRSGIEEATFLVVWGLFKKLFIADNLAAIVNPVFASPDDFSGILIAIAILAYTFQIYADFSGYTDIARGISKFLGYDIVLNFDLPYFSKSPQEFWRRWHMSLSFWARDYIYISLGGNRVGKIRTYLNLMATMLVIGLWHGANINFILWGAYQGILLVIHRLISPLAGKWITLKNRLTIKIFEWGGIVITFILIAYGWLIFRSESFGQIATMTRTIFTSFDLSTINIQWIKYLIFYIAILVLVQFVQKRKNDLLAVIKWSWQYQIAFYVMIILLMLVWGVMGGKEFIYAQF